MRCSVAIVVLFAAASACKAVVAEPESKSGSPTPAAKTPASEPAKAQAKASDEAEPIDKKRYPWLEAGAEGMPAPVDTLEKRFPTEKGFERVALPKEGFGAFLRSLPLAAEGTPVLSYRGAVVRSADHPNVAAVAALDVGNRDLQQCADAVIRLHAEWRWAYGHRDQAYRAASGTLLSFSRHAAGERIKVEGNSISLVPTARAATPTHALFRSWLDDVFGWANTGALDRDGQKVPIDALRPGDFFVLKGFPFGHTVLVLDMAKDASGRRAILLGQSFVPAQNFHVIRSSPKSAWFVLDEAEGSITTPFWEPFPFDSLRRLPE